MAKSPSRTPLIAAVILVLVTLAGFNALSEKYRPKTEKELEAQAAEANKAAQEAAAKNGKGGADGKAAPPPAVAAPGGTGTSALVNLGSDTVMGDKNAKSAITVGWSWTPDVQGDPDKVWKGIQALKQAAPNAQIRVVNTDEVPNVPDGVSVAGNVVVPLGADGSLPPAADAYKNAAADSSASAAGDPGTKK